MQKLFGAILYDDMKFPLVIVFMYVCVFSQVLAIEPYIDFREWRRLSNRDISRLGNQILSGKKDDWLHAESSHFIGHGTDEKTIDRALRKSEVAWFEAGQYLKLMPTRKKAHIYILDNAAWVQMKRKYHLYPEAKAFEYKKEIFITEDAAADQTFRDDVLHEVVHYRLAEAYRDKLPLVVEEGLAQYIGWQITKGYYSFHGHYLERKRPPLHPNKLYALDEFTQMTQYPTDPEAMDVFNRQAEAWIEAIVGLIGKENLGDFVKHVSKEKANWSQILIEQFDCTPEQIAGLADATNDVAVETDR